MCLARLCTTGIGDQRDQFPGRSTRTQPLVFTFEPIPDRRPKIRVKKRARRVLYPSRQVRRLPPTEKDMTKRVLLLLVSVVLFQVYSATEEELSLPSPDLGAALGVCPSASSSSSAALSAVFLAAAPGAEANRTQHPAGGDSLPTIGIIRSCRM